MSGQICWLSSLNSKGQLILHLRERPFDPWRPYTTHPQYKIPDYPIPNGSEGWSTYHKLRQAGWTLIPTAQAQNTFVAPEAQRVSKHEISMPLIFRLTTTSPLLTLLLLSIG